MVERSFEGRNGARVTVDVCQVCGGLLFDPQASLQLSPTGPLLLFHSVYGQRGAYCPRRWGSPSCPRCDAMLALVHDLAHNHRFHYSRGPQQELRKHVDTLLCSD